MHKIFGLTACAALAACAQAPGSIAPVNPGGSYAHLSCAEARDQHARETVTLHDLSKAQDTRRVVDGAMIVGLGLIGGAVNMMTSGNDNAPAIAVSKGKLLALETRISGCR